MEKQEKIMDRDKSIMKKICFVNYDMTVTGGVEQVTTTLANEFCKEYKVYIYAIFGKDGKVPYDLDPRITYRAELEEECRVRERIKRTFHPFKEFINNNKIDVVFLMENYPAMTVSPVRFFTKAKYVFCDHGALMNEWEKKDIRFFRFWDSLISHCTVTLTEQNRQDYIKKFHVNPKKIRSIYNWIKPEILKIKKPYKEKSKKIITVGRFSEEKGYDLLVEVARKVLPSHPDWEWHLYGTGDTFDEIHQKVVEYGLTSQLIQKGNVKDVYTLYNEYAFLVLSSYREGLPLVLLEAKASGLPMVSFDVTTGPREIIDDGKDGYLIPPYDLEVMVEKITALIEDENMRVTFSENSVTNIIKFEKEEIYRQWTNLIDELTMERK